MSEYAHVIRHVWVIPGGSSIVNDKGITIKNTEGSLRNVEEYEVDAEPFDKAFRDFDNTKYPEFCNIKPSIFKNDQLQSIPVDNDKLRDDERLRWIDENEFRKHFDPENGYVGVFPSIYCIEYTDEVFPVYSHNGKYLGFVENGVFTSITNKNRDVIPKITRLRYMIESLTKLEGKVSFEYLLNKYEDMNLNNYLEMLIKQGYIHQLNEHEYIYTKGREK